MEIDKNISELMEIVVGDGCLNRYRSKNRTDYKLMISGGHEETDFFENLKIKLDSVFNHKSKIKKEEDGLVLVLNSKKCVEYFESLGIPVGKKGKNIRVPPFIIKDNSLSPSFIRGLCDTDFCVSFKKGGRKNNSYPRISWSSISKNLVTDVFNILTSMGIKSFMYKREMETNFKKDHIIYCLDINGNKNLELWMEKIGFNNKKHLSKIEVWRELGYCPPHTTYKERLKILEQ